MSAVLKRMSFWNDNTDTPSASAKTPKSVTSTVSERVTDNGFTESSSASGSDVKIFVDTAPLPSIPTITQKREGGQLLLIRIDGA